MRQDVFELLKEKVRAGGAEAAFDFLIEKFREERNYPLLFEARLMKKRWELGLPLVWAHSLEDLQEETRQEYEKGYVDAAREVGSLFIRDGDIPHGWPYFRAIGEAEPVVAALEAYDSEEEIDRVIEIAFHEGVNPRRGLELILKNYGLCQAISSFSQYPGREGRQESLRLLVRQLYEDLVDSLKLAVARREGEQPDTRSLSSLLADRDWLFEHDGYHIDTSHLSSVVRFSLEATDRQTLALAVELTDYGKRLGSMFQYEEQPPFEGGYPDYNLYLRALMGEDVERAVEHFRQKVATLDPAEFGSHPAQVLVELLSRLERHAEAIEIFLRYLKDVKPSELACPSVSQLCQLAGEPRRLMSIAREQSDLLGFTAGLLQQ